MTDETLAKYVYALLAIISLVPAIYLAYRKEKKRLACDPDGQPYTWGFFFGYFTLITSVLIALLVPLNFSVAEELSLSVFLDGLSAFGAMLGLIVLGWLTAQRKRWPFVALSILTLSPLTVINGFYLKKRWAELVKESRQRKREGKAGLKYWLNNLRGLGRIFLILSLLYYLGIGIFSYLDSKSRPDEIQFHDIIYWTILDLNTPPETVCLEEEVDYRRKLFLEEGNSHGIFFVEEYAKVIQKKFPDFDPHKQNYLKPHRWRDGAQWHLMKEYTSSATEALVKKHPELDFSEANERAIAREAHLACEKAAQVDNQWRAKAARLTFGSLLLPPVAAIFLFLVALPVTRFLYRSTSGLVRWVGEGFIKDNQD